MTSQSDNGQTMLTVLVAVALASLALGFLAIRQPLTRSVPATADYQQAGIFSYSASGPSTIYDSATVTTGDPVYPQVTNNVDVRFEYHLTSDQTSNLSGTAGLDAEVSDATGWKRTIVLLQPAPFKGNAFITLGTLDLSQFERGHPSVRAIERRSLASVHGLDRAARADCRISGWREAV